MAAAAGSALGQRPPGVGGAGRGDPPGTDIFVTARTDFRAQLRRCQRLLAPGGGTDGGGGGSGGSPCPPPGELRLHGLGLAVPRAINLALQLQAGAPGTLRLHASTSSVEEEEEEEEEGGTHPPRLRHNSAIHIRVCREAPCA
ncbi:LOW QUALITY PROTEIN: ribonuclease P protein subunit p20 [Numenius arquata]|uniref:LOW QUALITY PROTEIN: ribonuclease P protein subunit p20 n=1 Tax=Numenius arquata TaxID=31919 RepID=UPI003D304661